MTQGSSISVKADDGHAFDVYLTGTGNFDAPVVLLYPAMWGLEGRVLSMADRWAADGYVVAVPDFLSRGKTAGVIARGEEGLQQAFARWDEIDVLRALEDSRCLLAELDRKGYSTDRFGALGYCAGAEMAWLAGTRLNAAAIVGFHPSRVTRHLHEAGRLKASVSLHFGGQDAAVPLSEVAQIQAALAAHPLSEVHVYGTAGHGFTFTDLPSYHALAESASRQRTIEVLRAALCASGRQPFATA